MTRRPFALCLLLVACATTGAEGEGDVDLPTAGVGPFRKLDVDEVRGIAPFVLDDEAAVYREPSVLPDGEATLMYAVAHRDGADVLVRSRALDARTFFGTSANVGRLPPVVLSADAPWEGGALAGPFAFRMGSEIFLYYAAAQGIGVARSSDGLTFRKEPGPALAVDPSIGWESTPPRAPTVFALGDGRLRMLYAAGPSIGEAESADGLRWTRLGREPVLTPAPVPPPGALLPFEKPPFDTAGVGDPCALVRTTPAGRRHLRVLYTGVDAAGKTTIGFAGRYADAGPLERQPVPVFSVGLEEAAPALLEVAGGSFLYVQQSRRSGPSSPPYLAIGAAFAPGTVKLPPPDEFPDSP